MKKKIKDLRQSLKNAEKWAKEKGVNLDAYDFELLCDGYNCQLTWNPAYHKMPYHEETTDIWSGKKITIYYTYFQLSKNCSSICSTTGHYNKETILERLRNTRKDEKVEKIQDLVNDAYSKDLNLFAITSSGDKFALLQAKDLKTDSSNHEALIIGGEFDGCTISTDWYGRLYGYKSEILKFIAAKRIVKITKKGKKAIIDY